MWGALLKPAVMKMIVQGVVTSGVWYVISDSIQGVLGGAEDVIDSVMKPIAGVLGYDPDNALNQARTTTLTVGLAFLILFTFVKKVVK